MLEGITAGFILSLTLFPGTVWLAKVGLNGRAWQVIAVGLAFWLSQIFWLVVAIPGLMLMSAHLSFIRAGMHLFAAFVLVYMAIKFFRAKRVEKLDDVTSLPSSAQLFRAAFNQSVAMPMRLPAAMAILLATGVYINHEPNWEVVPSITIGAIIGTSWWWGQFTFLALLFAKRVPQPITIKSLNKIRPFCAALSLFLALIAVMLGF
jgi:threonine/homoserine/homoserine lactone efflux protein